MLKKILIIENDPDMVRLLSILIHDMTPFKTIITNNPLEAIDMMKRANFSLVITEMNMPVMDGIEFLTAVKKIDKDIPVIILTSYGSVESAIEAMHKGASDYITKPFRKEQILYAIDKALKIKKLKKENIIMKKMLFISEESVCNAAS